MIHGAGERREAPLQTAQLGDSVTEDATAHSHSVVVLSVARAKE